MRWPLVGRDIDLDRARELVHLGTGIALVGAAGVGKSRLLHELCDQAEADGTAVIRSVATSSTQPIPFAPFVELLPRGPTRDPLEMLGRALTSLQERGSSGDLVLAIDDAHHLDGVSLTFVHRVVALRVATVCLTVRSGGTPDGSLVDLWTNGAIERIDLASLADGDVRVLVESVIGPIGDDVAAELCRLSRGNPLVLHELVEGAVSRNLVRHDDGTWTMIGPLAESPRLADLVGSRLRLLPDDLRSDMELIAVGAPVPLELATRVMGSALTGLGDLGFTTITDFGEASVVVPTHPLHGEVLEANLPKARQQLARRRLVEASIGASEAVDPLRVALWQNESGTAVSDEIALAGASEALIRHDAALALALVEAADATNAEVALIRGRALRHLRRFEDSEATLGDIVSDDQDLMGEVASARGQNLAFGLGRIPEARDLLEAAARTVADPELRARLNNERALVSAIKGDLDDSLVAADLVLSDDSLGPIPRAAAYVSLTVALAMIGDSARFDEIRDDAVEVSAVAQRAMPLASDQIGVMVMLSLAHEGHIGEALRMCEEAIAAGDPLSPVRSTWLSARSVALNLAGRHRQSADSARSGIELCAVADPFGLEPQIRGLLAVNLGQMGEPSADTPLEGLDSSALPPRLRVWVDRGRAWAEVARGDTRKAVDLIADCGRDAVAGGHFAWASLCLHDAVRIGQPEAVRAEMDSLPAMPGSHLLNTMIDHSRSLDDRDSPALAVVATAFARMGALLLAAEAWAQVAGISDHSSSAAARATLLSRVLEDSCEGAATPALRDRPRLITDREVEIAVDAAAGITSPQIAENRFLSVRTVENHLHSIYRKLDVSGRDELRPLLHQV